MRNGFKQQGRQAVAKGCDLRPVAMAASALLMGSGAWAQSAAPEAGVDKPAAAPAAALTAAPAGGERQKAAPLVIEVTARKTRESIQDVPGGISALSGKKLEEMGVTKFEDYALMMPSVSFQSLWLQRTKSRTRPCTLPESGSSTASVRGMRRLNSAARI